MRRSFRLLSSSAIILFINPRVIQCQSENPKDNEDMLAKFLSKGKDALNSANVDPEKLFDGFSNGKVLDDLSALAHSQLDAAMPGKIGFGFMMGYSSGFCLKKVSKVVAFVVGGFFIAVQSLSYNGYVKVNYDKMQQDIEMALDLNKDGKIDKNDFKIAYDKVHTVLSYNMPTGGGFTAGLILGLRS